jgi:DNA polymerase III epsilon subunit-like protein
MSDLYILDTETASLKGGVVELAFLRVNDSLEVLDEFVSHVDPECEIDPRAQEVHGITAEMVKGKPTLAEVAKLLPQTIDMIAHNAHFDKRMISPVIPVASMLCTLKLARAYIKGTTNFKLETLQAELALPKQTSHSALGDVHTVRDLLLYMVDKRLIDLPALLVKSKNVEVVHTMPFGKHQGKLLTNLPASYRDWLLEQELEPSLKFSLERLKGL